MLEPIRHNCGEKILKKEKRSKIISRKCKRQGGEEMCYANKKNEEECKKRRGRLRKIIEKKNKIIKEKQI
jgi:hypothetical protein